MPELPEVETIRRDLTKKILHKKISHLEIRKRKIIKSNFLNFKKILLKNSFTKINRIGKLLIFHLADNKNYLLAHLRMTGQLIYQQTGKYTRVIFIFSDQSKLYFNDLRQFGYLKIVQKPELDKIISKYGIEPLTKNFTKEKFTQIIKNKKISIKSVLLDQALISGIGNIYADESCFAAKINPKKISNKLSAKEANNLFLAIKKIIKKAISNRGTSFRNYVDATGQKGNFTQKLMVYGRAGEKCLLCKKGMIIKIKINGRGTSYCSFCQK